MKKIPNPDSCPRFASFDRIGRAWQDTIDGVLGQPSRQNQRVAGIETIHGWAFATNDAPRVSLSPGRWNHSTRLPPAVLWSTRRRAAGSRGRSPQHELFRCGQLCPHLGAGEHTVGVEIQAEGCEPVILEHSVTVATPGNIEFNEAFSFEDSWTGVDVHNDQILIVNATTGAEMGAANLRVDYALPTQNTGIVEAYNEDATTGATLDAVQAIFNARCLPCHSSENEEGHPVANLDLAEGHMPRNTIAAGSGQLSDGTLLINPGRPDESYLVREDSRG